MSILIWTPSLSVNIETIDSQHKKLFELANNFYYELYKNSDITDLASSFKELNDYTIFHFQTEEKLLLKVNHPEIDSHKKEHLEFINEMAQLNSQLLAGKLMISVGLINFLRNSIINHIFIADKSIVNYIK